MPSRKCVLITRSSFLPPCILYVQTFVVGCCRCCNSSYPRIHLDVQFPRRPLTVCDFMQIPDDRRREKKIRHSLRIRDCNALRITHTQLIWKGKTERRRRESHACTSSKWQAFKHPLIHIPLSPLSFPPLLYLSSS